MQGDLRATPWRSAVVFVLAIAGLFVATPARAVTGGSIEICVAPAPGENGQPFQFALNGGTPFSVLGGHCSGPLAVDPGPINVAEVDTDAAVSAIGGKPLNRQISSDPAGATATVAVPGGSTAATRTVVTFTHGSGPGTIEVCKSSANGMTGKPFQFSLNGGPAISVIGGACSGPLNAPAGTNVVAELSSTVAQTAAVDVTPASRLVTADVAAQTAAATVVAGSTALSETKVMFTNRPVSGPAPPSSTTGELKVCKVSNTPSFVGRLFTFSLNAGPAFSIEAGTPGAPVCSLPVTYPIGTRVVVQELDMPNVVVSAVTVSDGRGTGIDPSHRIATATVGSGATIVTFDNEPAPLPQMGFVEVCKDAQGDDVDGMFDFTITAPGFSQTASAYVGQCTGPIEVPGGNVTVVETARPGVQLYAVQVLPAERLFDFNLINRSATVEVPVGDDTTETQVHFVNRAVTAQLKVCKAIPAGSESLGGQTFLFDITRHADAATPGPTQRVRVQASSTSTQCSIVGAFPVGEQVKIDEVFQEDLAASDPDRATAVSGEFIDASGEGVVTIAPGINSVTVTNRTVGQLEICKAPIPGTAAAPPTFRFRIDGGPALSVRAGYCSLPQRVTVGTHGVQEMLDTDYELDPNAAGGGITATPAGRELGKNVGLRTITVSVPYGAAGETLTMFTNRPKRGWIKVCKVVPAGSQDALGTTAFSYTATVGAQSYQITNIHPGECSGPLGPFDVVQGGSPVPVTVSENGAGPAATFDVTAIACQGCRGTVTTDLAAGSIGFKLGPDTDSLTFTNAKRLS